MKSAILIHITPKKFLALAWQEELIATYEVGYSVIWQSSKKLAPKVTNLRTMSAP